MNFPFLKNTLRGARLQECEEGRGDRALLLLCDIFGHSSIAITKQVGSGLQSQGHDGDVCDDV